MLETLGVPVLGWRTETMPRFYDAAGGPPVTARVDSVDVAELDAGAEEQLITRSQVVAQIIREWADRWSTCAHRSTTASGPLRSCETT